MSDALVEADNGEDGDDPDGESLSGAVKVNVLVSGNSGLVSG